MTPRDRWVGASPGLNVTPGGKALEALDMIRALARQRDVTAEDVEQIIATVDLTVRDERPGPSHDPM